MIHDDTFRDRARRFFGHLPERLTRGHVIWRGVALGYGHHGFLRWEGQQWLARGRWHYAYGPVVLIGRFAKGPSDAD